MQMTSWQKICLVLGIGWLIFYVIALFAGLGPEESPNLKGGSVFVGMLVPLALLWIPTGVLKHLFRWFKGVER